MSIDLTVIVPSPIPGSELLENILICGNELVGGSVPEPLLFVIRNKSRVPVGCNVVIGCSETMLVLSWKDTDDGVGLITTLNEHDGVVITISVGATRSATEYVLGLIAAYALKKTWNVPIHDNNRFWGDSEELETSRILELFRSASGGEFIDVCRRLVDAFV